MSARHQHTLGFFFSLIVLFSVGCSKESFVISEPLQQSVSLLDVAKKDSRLTLFVQAAQRVHISRLERDDAVTLLAPTDAALTQYMQDKGYASIEAIPTATLQTLILNHMIPGDFSPSTFPVGYLPTLAEVVGDNSKEPIHAFVERGSRGLLINGIALEKDPTWTERGVLYTTNKVIEVADATTHILSNPKFSSFAAALHRSDLDRDYLALFKRTRNSTVWVPTNGAFASFLIEQRVSSLDKIPAATLSAILAYHLCPQRLLRQTQLMTRQSLPTLGSKTIQVEVNATGPFLVDVKGRKAQLEDTDIRSSNAIVHSINRILLPL